MGTSRPTATGHGNGARRRDTARRGNGTASRRGAGKGAAETGGSGRAFNGFPIDRIEKREGPAGVCIEEFSGNC